MRPYVTTLNMTQDKFSRISTKKFKRVHFYNGRDGKIRTCDPLYPKQVRYQAALRPDWLLY